MTRPSDEVEESGHFKDQILDSLAQSGNVAQFVSFAPEAGLQRRYSRVAGYAANDRFADAPQAIAAMLERSPEGRVNVRSFLPGHPQGHDFLYGLRDAEEILVSLRSLAARGFYAILNETIDVEDRGVSGVAFGGTVEFAPGYTPRLVEDPDVEHAELPLELAIRVLGAVYGFQPEIRFPPELRTEFSLHPLRRGYRHEHTILWEQERIEAAPLVPRASWPNEFSRFMGDKAYGLLLADALGFAVPRTCVIARRLAPFAFGRSTGTAETWLRTCPRQQVPGRYTTSHGWRDPFALIQQEDPADEVLSSVLAQEGVEARFSGATLTTPEGEPLVEGTSGSGQEFMQGGTEPEELPEEVVGSVLKLHEHVSRALGPVRFEWVHDGTRPWIVQLHEGASPSSGRTIVPGEALRWQEFDVRRGLEPLRELIETLHEKDEGVVLRGKVGITSHMADVLRRAGITSRIEAGLD